MMEEKALDEILDNLIKEYGPAAVSKMSEQDLENLDKPVFEYSKEHDEKMKEIFNSVRNDNEHSKVSRKDKSIENKTKNHSAKRVLLIAATLTVLIAGLLFTSCGAFRESFVKMFITQNDEYSDVNYRKNKFDYILNDVYFGYIPEGYKFNQDKTLLEENYIAFSNNSNKYIALNYQNSNVIPQLNTESGEVMDVVIRDIDMVYMEKNGMKFLTWNELNMTNTLYTDDSKEILFKVAKNIKFIK